MFLSAIVRFHIYAFRFTGQRLLSYTRQSFTDHDTVERHCNMISIMLSVVIVLTVVVMITMMMIVMMTTKMVMMVTKGQRHLTQMSREASRSKSVINFAGRPQR